MTNASRIVGTMSKSCVQYVHQMAIYMVCNIFCFFLNSPPELTFWITYICNTSFTLFWVSLWCLIFLQYQLSFISFNWIAQGDVDLHFSLVSLRKASAVEEETEWAAWLYHRCDQSMHLTEGVTVMPLCWPFTEDKLAHESSMWNCIKLKVIVLIQMWCKFWSCIKTKLCSRSHSQLDLPCAKIWLCHFTTAFAGSNTW